MRPITCRPGESAARLAGVWSCGLVAGGRAHQVLLLPLDCSGLAVLWAAPGTLGWQRCDGDLGAPVDSPSAAGLIPLHLLRGCGGWCCPRRCAVLRGIRDDIEKEHAFLGLCAIVRLNPAGTIGAFVPLCEAVVSWRAIGCEGLRNELTQLMQGYKQQLLALGQWDAAVGSLSPAVQEKLRNMFQL